MKPGSYCTQDQNPRAYAVCLFAVATVLFVVSSTNTFGANAHSNSIERLDEESLPQLASIVQSIWQGESPNSVKLQATLARNLPAVYIAFRKNGRKISSVWYENQTLLDALLHGSAYAKHTLGMEESNLIDTIEIAIVRSYHEPGTDMAQARKAMLANAHRGMRGLEISHGDEVERIAPTEMIATNRSFRRLLERFQERYALNEAQMATQVRWRTLDGEQILITLGKNAEGQVMERGNVFVPMNEVTQEHVQEIADLAGEWMFNNLHENGRMTYKYWPSRGQESPANNMIRQWMATVAMEEVAARRQDPALWQEIETNIDYNLAHFYREEGQYGLIEWNGKIKLGALALATIALIEHPKRVKWSQQEAALLRTIDSLWRKDGSFSTFYKPRERNDNQNFYPGETLLLWAILYEQKEDAQLLARFMKSFEYYRKWHLTVNRNPAFVPWHTQAYYRMWKRTKDQRLKDFIFEMNDWLVGMQQWQGDVPYRDMLGRFYAPGKGFGEPHSSSTGVYLEGLCDAFQLANEMEDEKRAEVYRLAVLRGFRSVMQLQFVDEIDMFYVSETKRRHVRGGIRTTVYDNAIRCDNVQHNLMAALKSLGTFDVEDYHLEYHP